MRTLSAHALSVFSQSGIEPVILIRVFWQGGNGITYSDRKFEQYGFQGKLVSVGAIDDTINVDNSSNSTQVSITLDDTDSSLKNIFNVSDIHKTKVQLLQWCTDLDPAEAFVIFTGQISSPIEWTEGDRTLRFDVLTQIEDRVVGFSIEDGMFPLFPSSLIGKSWPVIFGTVIGVPPLQILEAPSGIIAEGIAIVDKNVWDKELSDLEIQRQKAADNARQAYLNGIAEAVIASRYKGEASGGFNFSFIISDDPETAKSHDDAADNYFAQASSFTDDANNIGLQIRLKTQLYLLQKRYDKSVFKVNTINMPTNVPLRFRIGSATYTGVYNAGLFHVTSRKFPEDFNKKPMVNDVRNSETPGGVKTSDIFGNAPQEKEFGQKFLWVDAGTEIHVENFPLTFVVSVGPSNVFGVHGYRRGVRTLLPSNYYTVYSQQFGNTVCTFVTMPMPLTARTFYNGINTVSEGWDNDKIEVNAQSLVGPNTIDIMTWAISLFTKFGIDAASFAATHSLLNLYPMNFALLNKMNIVQFLQQLAFQARCSIWLNDDIFYIRYLPVPPTPVESITDDDIVLNSLIVTCTDTESIVTTFIANWRPNLFQSDPFKVIYQYNVPKYGYKPQEYDFFAYNQEPLVMKSAEFWLVRKANTFKILKFKTALHKIRLESFDAVYIDIDPGIVALGPVVGTVIKAIYNTNDKTIDVEVWLPIRFGEMGVYQFAEPYNVQTRYPLVNDPGAKGENPFDLTGKLPGEQYVIEQHTPYRGFPTRIQPTFGRDKPMGDAGGESLSVIPTGGGWLVDPARIGELSGTNSYEKWKILGLTTPKILEPTNAGFPGLVVSTKDKDAQTYLVDVYINGFAAAPKRLTVKQFQINRDDEVSPGTAVEVKRLVYRNAKNEIEIELWMQATVWQPAKDEEETGGATGTGVFDTGGSGGSFDENGEEDTGSGGSTDAQGDYGDITDEGYPDELPQQENP